MTFLKFIFAFLKVIFIILKVLFIALWPFILICGIIGWFLAGGDSSYISSQKPPYPDKKRLKKRDWLFDEDEDGFLGPDMREEYTRRDIVMKQRNQTFHDQDNFWK